MPDAYQIVLTERPDQGVFCEVRYGTEELQRGGLASFGEAYQHGYEVVRGHREAVRKEMAASIPVGAAIWYKDQVWLVRRISSNGVVMLSDEEGNTVPVCTETLREGCARQLWPISEASNDATKPEATHLKAGQLWESAVTLPAGVRYEREVYTVGDDGVAFLGIMHLPDGERRQGMERETLTAFRLWARTARLTHEF